MYKEEVIKKDLRIFINKLKKEEDELFKKIVFMKEHNFKKEQSFIHTKLEVLKDIRFQLEWFLENGVTSVKFHFNEIE